MGAHARAAAIGLCCLVLLAACGAADEKKGGATAGQADQKGGQAEVGALERRVCSLLQLRRWRRPLPVGATPCR